MVDGPLDAHRAAEALRIEVADLDERAHRGQIEILEAAEYYDQTIRVGTNKLSRLWTRRYESARAKGYSGLRVSGNGLTPLDTQRWQALMDYEQWLNTFIQERSFTALCCYGFETAIPSRMMEAFAQHEAVLIRQNGDWHEVANQAYRRPAASRSQQELDSLLDAERAARSHAEHLNRIKDEFLATVSHELRGPLAGILGWTRLVRRGGDDQEIKHGLEVVEQNAAVLAQLVDDLLDVSRIITGKIHLKMDTIHPETIIPAVINSLQIAANNKNILVERRIPATLPAIKCDPIRIRQVLWNLLTNAIKFTPVGGRITIAVRPDEKWLTIEVADTGEGIPSEHLPHIFDKFQQGGTTRKHGGLGLGLAIIKHILELHGGTIQATSEGSGKGATFTARLPITSPARVEDRPIEQNPLQDLCIEGLVIMLVDDDVEECDLVGRILKEAGAYIITAHSVEEAWTILARCRPDMLISDISMPGQDGYSLIRQIRSSDGGQGLPCIALSSLARPEDHEKALVNGFDEHLSKFVEPSELILAVRRVLQIKGHRFSESQITCPDSAPPRQFLANPHRTSANPRQAPHVLIAEDDPTTSEMLRLTLELAGYRPTVVETVEAAVNLAQNSPIDVVISDLRLKDGTGMDLMVRLRATHPVGGIMISGYSDETSILQSKAAGFEQYLVKPIDTDQLCDLLARMAPVCGASKVD